MPGFLDRIIERKKLEISELNKKRSQFNGRTSQPRGFRESLVKGESLAIIAEVKKASPSRGVIRSDFDPVAIACAYQAGGADAVSVLTDVSFFQGSAEYLTRIRENLKLPVLRKDFIIDQLQVEETAVLNADGMLLIAAALDDFQLKDLYEAAVGLGIDPLVEVHNVDELDRVMSLNPIIIGINNRNLQTFKTEISVTLDLIKRIPSSSVVVAESGIENGVQAKILKAAGVSALLVGESLMRAADPGNLIKELAI